MKLPEYITPGAFVRLRNGRRARIYATDGLVPIHGAIEGLKGWVSDRWFADGRSGVVEDTDCDIVGPWVETPGETNSEPDIVDMGRGWDFRPVLWLMCPESNRPGRSFQVGEFHDWSAATLARDRLKMELDLRSRRTQ